MPSLINETNRRRPMQHREKSFASTLAAAILIVLIATRLARAQGQPAIPPGGNRPANGSQTSIPSIAPAPPPPGPTDRPRIGLALAGGAALAMTEIGVLQWFEEHHVPVDMIAGTSMGAFVGALYATGHTPDQIKAAMSSDAFDSIFRFDTAYKNRNFRRREDSRDLPNALVVGLRHGVSLRNSLLTDQGLNSFFDREFYRYDDQSEFNVLPIPFRCIASDLNDAKIVTFARGSIPDAIRASVSLPGYYRPFEMNGHEYVDGGVLDNLPTQTVRDMRADVTLAVSIPLQPVGKKDLDSILGVLERSFAVAIESNERKSRELADVLMIPDVADFGANDYLKADQLAARGYAAAEQNKAALEKYAVNNSQWAEYLAARASRARGVPGSVLRVRVKAPNTGTTKAVEQLFQPLIDKPMNTGAVDAILADVRSDGRYDADYTVTYETPQSNRPSILITVQNKKTGPPVVLLGSNIEAETAAPPRGTIEGTLVHQDMGGYGSELRGHVILGWMTQADTEYFRKLPGSPVGGTTSAGAKLGEFFVAPRAGVLRQPFYIYRDQVRLSERQLQTFGGGIDLGWTDQRVRELRLGWEMDDVRWQTQVGSATDALPDVSGSMQKARIRYAYDTQDRALVPQYGMRLVTQAGYLFNAASSPNAPQITMQGSLAHTIGKNLAIATFDAGTMFHRNVAQPYRFTLGGPLRLSASAFDEYRGTDYFLLSPSFLRRIATLPQPLGQSLYLGLAYEAGQMRAPDAPTITRQDVYFGIVAETPFGVITLAPAIGDSGHRKFVFTLGKLF